MARARRGWETDTESESDTETETEGETDGDGWRERDGRGKSDSSGVSGWVVVRGQGDQRERIAPERGRGRSARGIRVRLRRGCFSGTGLVKSTFFLFFFGPAWRLRCGRPPTRPALGRILIRSLYSSQTEYKYPWPGIKEAHVVRWWRWRWQHVICTIWHTHTHQYVFIYYTYTYTHPITPLDSHTQRLKRVNAHRTNDDVTIPPFQTASFFMSIVYTVPVLTQPSHQTTPGHRPRLRPRLHVWPHALHHSCHAGVTPAQSRPRALSPRS